PGRPPPHGPIRSGQRQQPPRLALAREDGERHVVERAELIEEAAELERSRDPRADPLLDRLLRDVVAAEEDVALVGRQQPADQVDERRLARAVGADEGEHLALLHAEVDAVHRAKLAELLHHGLRLEQHAHRSSWGAAIWPPSLFKRTGLRHPRAPPASARTRPGAAEARPGRGTGGVNGAR